ncbi:hypothetical protein V5P93_000413 [Actinokineospora auranticolor]|uniref:Uncharacterized protein n=1 Tax=Actinokineospora auranticolor TaxID=155976 RepID=A0A2S6GE71_9PSEU|nr:hypothetical protein [Actinokineospora auranticolor]PPK63532.1 hypothetical protein CLV40_12759 [Actinokineospora auranticolor]
MPVTSSPDDLAHRITALERQVDELARGTLSNAVISSGGIEIRDLGGIKLIDQDGQVVFLVGGLAGTMARPDGTPQPITAISDDRGRWRITVMDDNPQNKGYRQYVAIWDYSGNIIVGDDVDSGAGLARPYIPHTVARSRYTDWAATTSSDWEALETATLNRQHPYLDAHVRCTSDNPDTRGEVRLRDEGSGVILASAPVGYVIDYRFWRQPMPGLHGENRAVHLEARRTAGTGAIRATFAYASGVQS